MSESKLRYPAIVEIAILTFITFVLIVGLALIWGITAERAQRAASVRAEIASSWGQSQTIGGPILIVPYRCMQPNGPGTSHALFLPERLQVRGTLAPETRHRGIYDTVVYRADLHIEGSFAQPDFTAWGIAPDDILWNQATLAFGMSDLRGMHGTALRWNGVTIPFSGGTPDTRLWPSGLTAVAQVDPHHAGAYPFSTDIHLNGSESIAFLPVGGETVVDLSAPWQAPSFSGAFLPESRVITPARFTAHWSISSLARSYPQRWRDTGDENSNALTALSASAFRVALYSPVSGYQQTERSIKYGALFIVLTFVTFFLYELLSPVTLHPVQYFLVGGALCVFYLLLLSISEQTSFGFAYSVAAVATVALICAYATALLRSTIRVLGLAGVLALLYGYLYVLLQLEDWALMMGSIGLFLILAFVMYTTRKVDWGTAHLGRATEAR